MRPFAAEVNQIFRATVVNGLAGKLEILYRCCPLIIVKHLDCCLVAAGIRVDVFLQINQINFESALQVDFNGKAVAVVFCSEPGGEVSVHQIGCGVLFTVGRLVDSDRLVQQNVFAAALEVLNRLLERSDRRVNLALTCGEIGQRSDSVSLCLFKC